MTVVEIHPSNDESRRLWASVAELAALLPADWVLIGGLMAQLHAHEAGVVDVRATMDIDVLGKHVRQARSPPSMKRSSATASSCSCRRTASFAATSATN